MIFDKKLLSKKIKNLTVREFLKLKGEPGNFYKDITEECVFKTVSKGGSNCATYGVDDDYHCLAIYYKDELLFKLDASSFRDKSVWVIGPEYILGEEINFHWLDNGSFMIIKKESWDGYSE